MQSRRRIIWNPSIVLLGLVGRVLALGGVLMWLAALVLMFIPAERADETGPPPLILVAVGCLLGYFILEFLRAGFQQHRNRSNAIHDQRGYFLYLRSLRAERLQSVTCSGGALNPSPNAFTVDDVLSELGAALTDIGLLFVLGTKKTGSMAWSPAAILIRSTERTWRSLFLRLARGARAIFIIPGETPGIIEELDEISQQSILHKVIVIMPPSTGRDARRDLWNSVATTLNRNGWRLPDFVNEGMVYAASDTLAVRQSLPYMVNGKRCLEAALRELLATVPQAEATSNAIAEVDAIEQGAA